MQYLFTGDNFYRHLDRESVIGTLSTFNAPSVHKLKYSNIDYSILADILERRAGKSIDTLLAERITEPLKLSNTVFNPEDLPAWSERAYGHAGDHPMFIRRGQLVPDWRFNKILRGSAALYSNARDLITYAAAHLRDDASLLSVALKDTLRVRHSQPQRGAAVAWLTDDVGGVRITYQVGIVAGYSGYVGIDIEHQTAVVVLQNAFNLDYSLGHKLLFLSHSIILAFSKLFPVDVNMTGFLMSSQDIGH